MVTICCWLLVVRCLLFGGSLSVFCCLVFGVCLPVADSWLLVVGCCLLVSLLLFGCCLVVVWLLFDCCWFVECCLFVICSMVCSVCG